MRAKEALPGFLFPLRVLRGPMLQVARMATPSGNSLSLTTGFTEKAQRSRRIDLIGSLERRSDLFKGGGTYRGALTPGTYGLTEPKGCEG
jgi:hypothetical protein